MKKLILIIAILYSIQGISQEELPIYNQYLFGSYFLINPGVAGIDNQWKVQVIHRQQWVGMEDAPTTQSLAGEGQLFNSLKMGAYVFLDKNGFHRQNGYHIAFSYVIPLSDESTKLKRISFGVSYSGSDKYIDQNDLIAINDPAFRFGQYKYSDHNSNVGIFMMWGGFYAGLAGSHLLSGGYDDTDYQNSYFPRNYNAIVGNKIQLGTEYFVEPSVMARVIENYDNHLDLNAKVYYAPKLFRKEANYWVGGSYRLSWKKFPLSSVSFAAFIGGSLNDFYYGYSYELMVDKYQFHHGGSHQFMIGYTLSLKGDRKCGCTPFSIPVL